MKKKRFYEVPKNPRFTICKEEKGERFFNLLDRVSGKSESENISKDRQRLTNIQREFMQTPLIGLAEVEGQKIVGQAEFFTTTADVSALRSLMVDAEMETAYYDFDWMAVFKNAIVDQRGFFDIPSIKNMIGWRGLVEGENIQFSKFTGENTQIDCKPYGAGLTYTDEVMRKRQLSMAFEEAEMYRRAYYALLADTHYAAIQLAAASNAGNAVAFDQTEVGRTAQLQKTLNTAAYQLQSDLKDKGFAVGINLARVPLLLFMSSQMTTDINIAIRETVNDAENSPRKLAPSIIPMPTFNDKLIVNENEGLLVFPKHYFRTGMYVNMQMAAQFDIKNWNVHSSGISYFGVGAALNNQVIKVALR